MSKRWLTRRKITLESEKVCVLGRDMTSFTFNDHRVLTDLDGGGGIGPEGPEGPQGPQGPQGIQGVGGSQGIQGVQGVGGDTGSQGIQGVVGDVGSQGIQGVPGDVGSQGIQGLPGDDGAQGIQGLPGDDGAQGIQGIQGIQGDSGTFVPKGLYYGSNINAFAVNLTTAWATVLAGGSTVLTSNFVLSNQGGVDRLTYTGATGVFNVLLCVSIAASFSSTQTVEFAIALDGVVQLASEKSWTSDGITDYDILTMPHMLTITNGQRLEAIAKINVDKTASICQFSWNITNVS